LILKGKLQQAGRNKFKAISKYITQLLLHPRNAAELEALNTLTQATYISRSWLRASSMIKLNKNQADAHQF
jgi:hypothetical protein